MVQDSIIKIIDFAIEREKEAVEFYQNLQFEVQFKSKADLLKKLELIELSHIDRLNELKNRNLDEFESNVVEDLKISDYLVEPPSRDDLTYQDILIIAIKKEESAYKLYFNLADRLKANEPMRKVFLKLASEEANHKKYFEEIYDDEILQEN